MSEQPSVYRVRTTTNHPLRRVRKAWYGRTYQAEWEGVGWCPRAYTARGIRRKAYRWQRRGYPTGTGIAIRRWGRRHVTQRWTNEEASYRCL